MKPAPFAYHRPTTVEEALARLAELGDEAKVLAGGQSLVPMLSMRLAYFDHLIDVSRLEELAGVDRVNGSVRVGAATRDVVLESDPSAAAVPLLPRVTPYIGHFQIRNRGTVGGSLAHADPAGELPTVAVALDADLEIASARGRRTVGAAEFFEGIWTTVLEPDELLVGSTFPVWQGRCGFAVEEAARRHGDFALAGAMVAVQLGGDDRIERCAIALMGMGPTPVRAKTTETNLRGTMSNEHQPRDIGAASVAEADNVPADLHAPASYRVRVGAAMVARAWSRAVMEANDG